MPQSIGQLTYSVFNNTAQPGQLADLTLNSIGSFPAAETVNPGRFVEMASDGLSVQQPQQTSSTFVPEGVAVFRRSREGSGAQGITAYGVGGPAYVLGETVPVLLSGRIYAEWKGTTQSAFARPNVYHSSTTATDRGKVTDASTSTGAGTEIAQAPSGIRTRQTLSNTGNVILIDVNLPTV